MVEVRSGLVGLILAIAAATVGCGGDENESNSGTGGQSGSGATSGGGGASGGNTSGGTASGGTGGGAGAAGGIAQGYPGDQGIEGHPDVIFADDFETYGDASQLWDRWDNTFQQAQTRIATESGNVYAGNQALEFTMPQGDTELSNAVQKVLTTELDALYLRWYSKFEANNDIVGSSHNGGGMSAHYFDGNQATPGIPADGTNKFLVEFEHWRGEAATQSPGLMNVYVYHPLQRDGYGDHFFPSGLVMPNTSLPFDFGADFEARPEVIPELDRWYCYELLVRANTPGEVDGRITLWLDGAVIADFGNLRLRDVATLKLDRFNLSFHARSNPSGATRKYYDNVVAATSYIGPMVNP
jgi:hypothetical protein